VQEYRIEVNPVDHLQIKFDIRIYRSGDVTTDIIFANEKTFSEGIRDLIYDVTIGPSSNVIFQAKAVKHHRSSTWRKRIYSGDTPQTHVIYNIDDLIKTGAILPLDYSYGILAKTINRFDTSSRDLPPLHPSIIVKYFPTSGGRPEIGIYPQWVANYLVAQSPHSKNAMLAIGDAGGAIPWHFRDEKTNAPVSIEVRKNFWADQRGLEDQYYPDRMHKDIFQSDDGDWVPDQPHKPDLFYIPYMVTGDHYYADELAMQAAYAIFGRWPFLREGKLKAIDIEQVRGSAWSLRDIGNSAFLLPDEHPLKGYLNRVLDNNLSLMVNKYVTQRLRKNHGAIEGYFDEHIGRDPQRISPWQQDYFNLALWSVAHRGNLKARTLQEWATNFHTSRFLSPNFDFKQATSFSFSVRDANDKTPYQNWSDVAREIYKKNDSTNNGKMQGYPDSASSYVASALANLTGIANNVNSLSAYSAIGLILKETENNGIWQKERDSSVYAENQYFFSISSLDHKTLSYAQLINLEKTKTLNFKNSEQGVMILGKNKSDKITASQFGDIIWGGNGDDIINSGKGRDLIIGGLGSDNAYGNDGDDIFIGAQGDDQLTGGNGADIYAYLQGSIGRDTIKDFDLTHDKIGLTKNSFAKNIKDNFQSLISDSPKGAIITLINQGEILLENVNVEDITQNHFIQVF